MAIKINKFALIGAVFGIIAALSIFLPWVAESFIEFDGAYSGWDIFDYGEGFDYYVMPLAIAALGVFFAAVMLAAPKGNVTYAIALISGLAVIALAFYTAWDFAGFLEDGSILAEAGFAFGSIITMISGFGMLAFGMYAE